MPSKKRFPLEGLNKSSKRDGRSIPRSVTMSMDHVYYASVKIKYQYNETIPMIFDPYVKSQEIHR
jgi:hypothetical protein